MCSHPNGREPRARRARGLLAALFALALPAGAEHETILISADRVHVRPGHVLEDARVLVERGRIVAVGPDVAAPAGAREIAGAVVCAGFVDPWSSFGVDPAAVADDKTSPATRTVDALDPYVEPERVDDVLRAGVTSVRTQAGTTGRAGGLGALVRLPLGEDGVILDDSVVAMRVGTGRAAGDPFGVIDDVDRVVRAISDGDAYLLDWTEYRYELEEWEKAIAEQEAELEKDFKKAKKDREKDIEKAEEKGKEYKEKKYKEDKKPRQPKYDADKAVMARVADGEVPLVVEAHEAAALRELLAATESFGRLRMMVAGGTEALAVADELAERKIPVIVAPVPVGAAERERFEGVDLELCARLHEKGVRVLIGSGDGANAMATRDLPLMAALAVGHGLDREVAFEALTIGAARALDVAGRVGTIERGKDADLLVLDGEPLGLATRVQYVVSGGRIVIAPEDE